MSVVGQKQKSNGALPSSAFHPGADIAASACGVRKVPKAGSRSAANSIISIDHLIGDCNKGQGHLEAESLRCFEVDDEFIR